jgi:hypothetical protein
VSDFPIDRVPTLIVVWVAFVLAGQVYFVLDRNAPRKRMLWPFYVAGYVTAFVGVVLFYGGRKAFHDGLFFIPVILLIGVLNFYKVRFCDTCGATVGLWGSGLFPRRHCHKCGSVLSTWGQ